MATASKDDFTEFTIMIDVRNLYTERPLKLISKQVRVIASLRDLQ